MNLYNYLVLSKQGEAHRYIEAHRYRLSRPKILSCLILYRIDLNEFRWIESRFTVV